MYAIDFIPFAVQYNAVFASDGIICRVETGVRGMNAQTKQTIQGCGNAFSPLSLS